MRTLLDTHILIDFAYSGLERFSPSVRALLEDEETERIVSTVSLTEIALKAAIGKLSLDPDHVFKAIDEMAATILPFATHHVRKLFTLPLLHREPFDRMLIATALAEDVPLVSIDRQFPKYRGLRLLR